MDSVRDGIDTIAGITKLIMSFRGIAITSIVGFSIFAVTTPLAHALLTRLTRLDSLAAISLAIAIGIGKQQLQLP